ncbi:MAG: fused MFS/spermidine synthase [Planctomycetes bacterium]|nr:fused MFS/spermidine synthase [Planctomycetota bacterium]
MAPPTKAPALPAALSLAFAASGFAALVDEIAAARYLTIPLGADAPAVAAVLSALLVGFAAGGFLAGKLLIVGAEARRFALLTEAGLALCALAAPFTFPLLGTVVAATHGSLPIDGAAFQCLRFALALAACLPAALLMGATFPIALRLARASGLDAAAAACGVYAVNTAGATLGAAASGFVLLPFLGYTGTFHFAAGANALSFLLIYRFARRSSSRDGAAGTTTESGIRSKIHGAVLIATFAAGFFAFAMEVLFTRVAIGVFGASTYAFTAVLVAFLTGIAIGAPIAGRAARDYRRSLGFAIIAAGILALAGLLGFYYYLGLRPAYLPENLFPQLSSPWMLPIYQTAIAMILFLPPAVALGAAFPLAVSAARSDGKSPDRAAAAVYAWNTAGSLAGALLATFVLLPILGLRAAIPACAACAVGAGIYLILPGSRRAAIAAGLIFIILGAVIVTPRSESGSSQELLYLREGASSTVVVTRSNGDSGPMKSISVNGTVVATEALLDLRLQRLLGHLPALLHPAPSKTLVIGLGSGVTAGALATTPGVERVDIVELERNVVDAAREFELTNRGVASGKLRNVNITIADGRSHLLTTREKYDVVTCDPIHPWVAGAGNLYSRECFERERACLADGGIAALWLPLYKLREDDIRVVAKTFTSVFDPCAVYITGYDAILLGANGRFPRVDSAQLRARFANINDSMRAVEVRSAEELLSGFAMETDALRAYAGDAPENTDLRPILEFRAPLLYLTNYATGFLSEVRGRAVEPDALFGPGAAIDPRARAAAVALRSAALGAFLKSAETDIRRAIQDASDILRRPR